MTTWDHDALIRLRQIAQQHRQDGVVDMLHEIIGHVWSRNVDRYEPTVMGDTNKSLGGTAAENIMVLALRTMIDPESWNLAGAVRVGAPQQSLLVTSHGVNLHVVKAPATKLLRHPEFEKFSWSGQSETRAAAANANALRYDRGLGAEGSFWEGQAEAIGSVEALKEVFLIWAGGSDAPNTAAWLGFPTSNSGPWLAVEPLWWDDRGTGPSQRLTDSPDPTDSPDFSDIVEPDPVLTLKSRPKTAEQ